MSHVVCVINEGSTRQLISEALKTSGLEYSFYSEGDCVSFFAEIPEPAAFLIDASPGPDTAIKCCQIIRKISDLPILVLISPDENPDLPQILAAGADDFKMLPIRASELTLRLHILIRRSNQLRQTSAKKLLTSGDLVLDVKDHRLWKNGEETPLSPLSFQILCYFMQHVGEATTKHDLTRKVWGYAAATENSNLVETGIARLRRELGENSKNPVYIHTIWSKGYRFEPKSAKH